MAKRMVRFECHARWRVLTQDDRKAGWRGWLASRLRALATRLDGVSWFTVLSDSTPRLTPEDANRCLEAGLEHGGRLWWQLAHERAFDEVTRAAYPELYAEAGEPAARG